MKLSRRTFRSMGFVRFIYKAKQNEGQVQSRGPRHSDCLSIRLFILSYRYGSGGKPVTNAGRMQLEH